jgi:hypothetical protein
MVSYGTKTKKDQTTKMSPADTSPNKREASFLGDSSHPS